MTEELLKRLYKIKKENGYLTQKEIISEAFYDSEMRSLNEAMEETYLYIWENFLKTFMRTKQDVKKEFKIYNLKEYLNVHNDYYADERYYDYARLSEIYKKHICFIKLEGYDLFFPLEDLMEKLIEDGFNASFRIVTRFGILSLALSQDKIDEYLDEATHYMILKREN